VCVYIFYVNIKYIILHLKNLNIQQIYLYDINICLRLGSGIFDNIYINYQIQKNIYPFKLARSISIVLN
jgi:hypothetical protein